MNGFGTALVIAKKDLRLEFRTKDTLLNTIMFGVLVVLLGALAFYTDSENSVRVAPGVLWVAILFSGILLMSRSWAHEREADALDGLLLTPMQPSALYWGKTISAFCMLSIVEAVVLFLVGIFFQIDLLPHLGPLLLLLLLGTLGFVATGSLFSALSVRGRARDLVLSVVIFPLISPALLCSAVATRELLGGATLSELAGWLYLLVAMCLGALGVGTLLFEQLIDD